MQQMALENQEVKDQAEFNSAITVLNRLNVGFAVCMQSRIALDSSTWFHTCMAVWAELSPYCSPAQESEFEQMAINLNSLLNKKRMMRGTAAPIDHDLYWGIDRFEKKLRSISHAHGLDMKMKEDRRFGL